MHGSGSRETIDRRKEASHTWRIREGGKEARKRRRKGKEEREEQTPASVCVSASLSSVLFCLFTAEPDATSVAW